MPSGYLEVEDGTGETRRWPLVYTRELPADQRWYVAWQDTRGTIRDPTPILDEHRTLMTESKTVAEERAG